MRESQQGAADLVEEQRRRGSRVEVEVEVPVQQWLKKMKATRSTSVNTVTSDSKTCTQSYCIRVFKKKVTTLHINIEHVGLSSSICRMNLTHLCLKDTKLKE